MVTNAQRYIFIFVRGVACLPYILEIARFPPMSVVGKENAGGRERERERKREDFYNKNQSIFSEPNPTGLPFQKGGS